MAFLQHAAAVIVAVAALMSSNDVFAAGSKNEARRAALKADIPRLRSSQLKQSLLSKARPISRKLGDYADDYYYEEEAEEDRYGFDVASYSLKYVGCSAVETYSDELAEQEEIGTVLQTKRFVIFRLCPTDTCNKYSIQGCGNNYGEYVVDMDDYMEILSEFQDRRYDEYCNYCEPCWNNNRRLNDGNDQGDDGNGGGYYNGNGEYCDLDFCEEYSDICYAQQNGNNGNNFDMGEFSECREYEGYNGYRYYLAPRCESNGYTISLGVYGDETCSIYIGESYSVQDVMGYDPNIDFSSLEPDCISCEEFDMNEDGNNNGDDAVEDEDRVAEVCEQLYESSAKCNKNLYDAMNNDDFTYPEIGNEELACEFIETLLTKTYTEEGEIVLTGHTFNSSNWMHMQEYFDTYQGMKETVTPAQVALLALSVGGCLVLLLTACFMHAKLRRKQPWRPKRGKFSDQEVISRQNSGIVMGRSTSGGTAPLI